jgi:dihydroorotase
MQSITITAPDDWHLHLRDNEMLIDTVAATSSVFRRAIVMPNLTPPVSNAEQALAYKQRILDACDSSNSFEPLMTLYLTDQTTGETIKQAKAKGIPAAKLYPAGATTNSEAAVNAIESLFPVFETMQEVGMLLLIHGEVTHSDVDIFDREKRFIDDHLIPIVKAFPKLKIVFEHITTSDAGDFVLDAADNIAATITPQHLMLNRNDLLVGGIRPHNYCLPVLKRNTHQQRLRELVQSGSSKFFLGTDSAPHTKTSKESACGCAGCFSAPHALQLYTQVFEELDALEKLEAFASHYGPDFYGLPRNKDTVTLVKDAWTIPEQVDLNNGEQIVPLLAGQSINWKIAVN